MAQSSNSSSSSSSREEEEPSEIRQRAYDLLTRMGGPDAEEEQTWPQSPSGSKKQPFQYSSYQQQAPGEASPLRSSSSARQANPPFSFAEVFVHCISDACKKASSEAMSQQASVFKSGYDSLRTVVIPEAEERWFSSRAKTYAPVSGTYQPVDIPQGYRGRYQDVPHSR